ncbi:MAG: discoidin domain-containing protein, partial [Planctomycetia bacterium]|nr:discoidin domain-containing protein [Planctomycetia bacterium]
PKPAPGVSTGNNVPPPHELVVDLTEPFQVRGIVYTPRKGGENGTIGKYEVYVSGDTAQWGEPVVSGEFAQRNASNPVLFGFPVTGRYVKLVGLTEVNDAPFTSVAELEIQVVEDVRFIADRGDGTVVRPPVVTVTGSVARRVFGLGESEELNVYQRDLVTQYHVLAAEISDKSAFYEAIRGEIYREEAGILPTDR